MAKAYLVYADADYAGPVGDGINGCIVVAADAAAAVVLAKALTPGDIDILWDNATAVDLDTTFTTGSLAFKMLSTPVAFT